MNDQELEQEIQAKGLTAPRVTPAQIQSKIKKEFYFTANEGVYGNTFLNSPEEAKIFIHQDQLKLLTFCVLVLENGFTVTGESACASPENFDPELGKKIAKDNAIQKVWALEGYLLKEQLFTNQGK